MQKKSGDGEGYDTSTTAGKVNQYLANWANMPKSGLITASAGGAAGAAGGVGTAYLLAKLLKAGAGLKTGLMIGGGVLGGLGGAAGTQ